MSSFKQKIDKELHNIIFHERLKARVIEKTQKNASKISRFLNREVQIPLTPMIAVCMAVMIVWSAGLTKLTVKEREIRQSKIKVVSVQKGVVQHEND